MSPRQQQTLRLHVERKDDRAVVSVDGEVSLYEVDRFRAELEALAALGIRRIVLDLAGMTFICSAGLGAMVSAHLQCRHNRGQIRLAAPRHTVRTLLEATRLTHLFAVYDSLEQALAD